MSKYEKVTENDLIEAKSLHAIWHKFEKWLIINFGENYSFELTGFDAMSKVEKYVKKYVPEIKVIQCDDAEYGSSIILLVPHPRHGITVMFIPQSTQIQNQFFLYSSHFDCLQKELSEMKKVYDNTF